MVGDYGDWDPLRRRHPRLVLFGGERVQALDREGRRRQAAAAAQAPAGAANTAPAKTWADLPGNYRSSDFEDDIIPPQDPANCHEPHAMQGILPPWYPNGVYMVVRTMKSSPGFECRAYNLLPPEGKLKRIFQQGEIFGPVEMVVQDQSEHGSFVAVMVTGLDGHPEWVNVWSNRNRQGAYVGTDYAYPCNRNGTLYNMTPSRIARQVAAAAEAPAAPPKKAPPAPPKKAPPPPPKKAPPVCPPEKARPPKPPAPAPPSGPRTVPFAGARATADALPAFLRQPIDWTSQQFLRLFDDPTRALEEVFPNGRWYALQGYNAHEAEIKKAFKCLNKPSGPTHFVTNLCRHNPRYADRVDSAVLAKDLARERRLAVREELAAQLASAHREADPQRAKGDRGLKRP